MARKIPAIRQFLIDTLVSKAASIGITINPVKWSKYDYKLLILDTVATGQAVEEQLWDAYKDDINSIISLAAPETAQWIKDQLINKYQFSADIPQVVGIYPPNFNPSFQNPNDNLKIIKYCSVKPGIYGTTLIKVAAQVDGLPADIDTTHGAGTLDTVRAFVRAITNSSITKFITSGSADRLWMQLDVYYNGLYASVIQNNVILAIDNFLKNITYDGSFIVTDLEVAIKNVEGVTDCVFINMRGRDNLTAFPGGSDLRIDTAVIDRVYNSIAGYIVREDTTDNSLTDPRPLDPSINNLNLIPIS
jgi:hypothetical protein